jgi:hypothetical protein
MMGRQAIILTRRQRIFRALGRAAGIVLLPAWFFFAYLENKYVTWPREPNAETGRTIPYHVKTIIVYITEYDQQLNTTLWWILIGSGSVFVIALLFSGDVRRIMNGTRDQVTN